MIKEQEIDEAIKNTKSDFYRELGKIISIKSVKGPEQENAPFGKGPKQALTTIVDIIQKMGFKAKIVNNAMAYAQWGDDDKNYIGIIDHLDVVPEGDKWISDPYTLTKRGDKYYARGILDNKGPAFSTLWGMKLLKDLGYKPKHTIRLVFGSDEESGSADVKMYLKKENPPMFGWTADCKYPVVYGERGIVNYAIFTPIDDGSLAQIEDIKGDMSKDHVPDEVSMVVNGKEISFEGKRVPSNAPELGKNSITYLSKKMIDDDLVTGQIKDYFEWIVNDLHEQHFGEGLGIAFKDEDSGKLIMTPTGISTTNKGIIIELAMRYPVSFTQQDITDGLSRHLPKNSQIKVMRSIPSVMHDKNSKYIKVLSEVYEKVTGLDGTPVTTTGATYARVMPNIIAFGPSFPGQKGIAHKENEWMNDKDLMLNMKIYMMAIMELGLME